MQENKKSVTGSLAKYASIINSLHTDWTPHSGQIHVGRAVFQKNKKKIFVQCGRKWGKTEIIEYILWRWCQQFPGSSTYYISPFFKQSKEIIWANNRIQTFGPKEWLLPGSAGTNKSELRLNFKNGSFIKLDGSENFDAYRGIEPHLVVYEEFKDFRPEFHIAMEPNFAVYSAPNIIIGTPPDRECQYLQLAKEYQNDEDGFFIKAPSYQNPFIKKQWLDKKKVECINRGEWDVWEREYMGEYVPGGISKIFPMLEREKHLMEHDKLWLEIRRDLKKLDWLIVADPAAASVFGVLFLALNPYSKKWYILDEIYETDQAKMTVDQIGRRIQSKKEDIWYKAEWRQIYDEASTWFANEMMDRFEEYWEPTKKSVRKKEQGLSIIKDSLLLNRVSISDKCEKLWWEADNYYKDKTGKIPKMDDHLLDCWRYGYDASYYELNQVHEPIITKEDRNWGRTRIGQDFPGLDDHGNQKDFDEELMWQTD